MEAIDYVSRLSDELPDSFAGIVPGKGDALGDNWARAIGELFDRTIAKHCPELSGAARHRVWLCWQWLYCEIAGCHSRIIARPQAMIAAGLPLTPDEIELSSRLVKLSGDCLD